MELVYEILGKRDQHILAAHISHLHEICKEILGFIENDRLEDLAFYSFAPARLRGTAQILNPIYERFKYLVSENEISDSNVIVFMQNFQEFINLVGCLEKAMERFNYDYRDDSALLKYTYGLVEFFRTREFYVEDSEFY